VIRTGGSTGVTVINRDDRGRASSDYGGYVEIPDNARTQECRKYIDLCKEAISGNDVKGAKQYAFRAASANRACGNYFDAEIADLDAQVAGMGQSLLDEADKLLDAGKVVAASAGYNDVIGYFGSAEVGRLARQKLNDARQSVAGRSWAEVMESEAKGEFEDLVGVLKAEWARTGAETAQGQVVQAEDIIMQMAADQREAIKRRIARMGELYGPTSYGLRVKQLLQKVETSERAQLSAGAF